jgi:hypothetical protein
MAKYLLNDFSCCQVLSEILGYNGLDILANLEPETIYEHGSEKENIDSG